MMSDPTLIKVSISDVKIKKVTDHVHHLINTRTTVSPYKLPEDNALQRTTKYVAEAAQSMLSASRSVESGWVEWTDEKTQLIENAFGGFEKFPRNPTSGPSSAPLQNSGESLTATTLRGFVTK